MLKFLRRLNEWLNRSLIQIKDSGNPGALYREKVYLSEWLGGIYSINSEMSTSK